MMVESDDSDLERDVTREIDEYDDEYNDEIEINNNMICAGGLLTNFEEKFEEII